MLLGYVVLKNIDNFVLVRPTVRPSDRPTVRPSVLPKNRKTMFDKNRAKLNSLCCWLQKISIRRGFAPLGKLRGLRVACVSMVLLRRTSTCFTIFAGGGKGCGLQRWPRNTRKIDLLYSTSSSFVQELKRRNKWYIAFRS